MAVAPATAAYVVSGPINMNEKERVLQEIRDCGVVAVMGGDIIKVFPATRMGPSYIKDLRAPLPHIPLLPTGGVEAGNAAEWIKAGAVALGVGGKLVDRAAIKAGDWDEITRRARELIVA